MKLLTFATNAATATLFCVVTAPLMAQQLNELEPNADGADPDPASIELLGVPNADFDLWILSVEGDSTSSLGLVDRAANVTGTYDSDGLAVVMVPDHENPTNTVILTGTFSGTEGTTDIDPLDTGLFADLDLAELGTIYDAVGIPDVATGDTLYGAVLGGTDLGFNGQFEPLSIFREQTTGDWYQTVTVDFGLDSAHVGVFEADGPPELSTSLFASDPLATTFGSVNPALIPEPASAAMLMISLIFLVASKRRN